MHAESSSVHRQRRPYPNERPWLAGRSVVLQCPGTLLQAERPGVGPAPSPLHRLRYSLRHERLQPSPDSDAFRAAGGRSARAVVPIPPPTPAETLVLFRTVAVVAGDCPIRAIPCRKIGKRVDCRIGGMLGVAVAPSPAEPALLPSEQASVTSPSSDESLSSAGKPRAVVDAGGASLPSTEWSRVVVDAVVASLPLAARPRAVDDASSSSSSSLVSTRGDNTVRTVLPST